MPSPDETSHDVGPAKAGLFERVLEKLGLHRPELRAWAMYDWANSAMVTTIITAVFPDLLRERRLQGSVRRRRGRRAAMRSATVIGMVIIALLSPVLGTIADLKGDKKKMLGGFLALGVFSVAGMFFIYQGDWILASVLFILANIGANGSFVFYDALLPHVAREDEIDRVSTAGYALGYVGGGTLLALNLAWIMKPEWFGLPSGDKPHAGAGHAAHAAGVPLGRGLVAGLFDPAVSPRVRAAGHRRRSRPAGFPVRAAFARLLGDRPGPARTPAGIPDAARVPDLQRRHRHDHAHGDDLRQTRSGSIRTIDDRGDHDRAVRRHSVRVPLRDAGRPDRRQAIDRARALVVYMAICVFGYFMKTATHFLVLAILVGAVQGGTQALSRSLFASLIPQGQVGRVLRVLRGRREIRGHPRAGGLRRRVEPQRDPGDHRVLRRRWSASVLRRRRRGPAHWRGPTKRRALPA